MATIAILAIWTLLGVTFPVVTGCDVGMNMAEEVVGPKTEPDTPAQLEPTTTGEIKQPEETTPGETEEPDKPDDESAEAEKEPDEPTLPADTPSPTVVKVAWYSDQGLTRPIKDDIHPGDTIYTLVVFSEPMQHVVANDKTARPALSIVIDGTATRYRIRPHEAGIRSGEARPFDENTFDYLCRYKVPENVSGAIALRVDKTTANLAGTTIAEVSEHIAPFMITEAMIPDPEELVDEQASPQERAEQLVNRIIDQQSEDDIINDDELMTEVLEEETGLSYEGFIRGTLYDIYLEERPEDKGVPFSWYDIVLEYMRLTFAHPNATEAELLDHFRQSVREGRVEVDIHKSTLIQARREKQKRVRIAAEDLLPQAIETRRREWDALRKKHEDPTFDLDAARNEILQEELGVSLAFAHDTLLKIHLEEFPEDQEDVDEGLYTYAFLIFNYLMQSTLNPDLTEQEVLEAFRTIIRKQPSNITISIGTRAAYGLPLG